MTTTKPKIITLEEAVEKMRSWPVKFLVIGMRRTINEEEYVADSVVCNSEQQLMKAIKRFVYHRIFSLTEI